jgi:filamin
MFLDAGKGVPEVIILDPAGRENTIPVKLRKEPNGVYICDYTPIVQGVHSVNVFFANQPVPLSPFAVGIANGNGIRQFSLLLIICSVN